MCKKNKIKYKTTVAKNEMNINHRIELHVSEGKKKTTLKFITQIFVRLRPQNGVNIWQIGSSEVVVCKIVKFEIIVKWWFETDFFLIVVIK